MAAVFFYFFGHATLKQFLLAYSTATVEKSMILVGKQRH